VDLLELFKDADNVIEIEAETTIFSKGDEGHEMYVVLEGIVAVSIGYEVIDIVEAGDIMGEMAIIDAKTRSATAVAKTHCRMISVSKEDFLSRVQQAPDFSLHVMTVQAQRLRSMIDNLEKNREPTTKFRE
jgi:CRP/FNR family cyclic AMP-dependent transcriptional regulator